MKFRLSNLLVFISVLIAFNCSLLTAILVIALCSDIVP